MNTSYTNYINIKIIKIIIMLWNNARNNCRCIYRGNLKDFNREVHQLNYVCGYHISIICNSFCDSIRKDVGLSICRYMRITNLLILIAIIVILPL